MQLESRLKTDTAADRVSIEVRKRLSELGQSQAALARVLGESPMWVSQRLNGTVQMGVNDLDRIAGALGLKLSTLIDRAERGSNVTPRDTQPYEGQQGRQTPVVSGTIPHPEHPILTRAVRLPLDRRTALTGR